MENHKDPPFQIAFDWTQEELDSVFSMDTEWERVEVTFPKDDIDEFRELSNKVKELDGFKLDSLMLIAIRRMIRSYKDNKEE